MAERILAVRLRAIVDGYESAMGRAATATEKVAKTGKQMESVGKKMTVGFTMPMLAAGGVALKASTSYESAFAGVRKTVNATEGELASLSSGIIDMALSMPSTREEIAGVAEAAGQLGIETPNILEFTRTIIDLGNSTDLVGEQGASMLAQFANITQMPQNEFTRLGSTIVELGNNGAATESQIVDMGFRLAGVGNQVGMTEAQIMGMASALADLGLPAEMGGSAVSRVLNKMQRDVIEGGDALDKFAQIAGMSGDEFAQLFQRDAASAFSEFTTGLGRVGEAGGSTAAALDGVGLAEQRTLDAMNRLVGGGDRFATSQATANRAWEEGTALTEEAGQRYATTESRLKVFGNQLSDTARRAGDVMVPALQAGLNMMGPFIDGVGGLVDGFGRLHPVLQAGAGSILAIAVASGPAIWAMGKLAKLYGPAMSGIVRFNPALAIAGIRNWTAGVWGAVVAMRTAAVTGTGMQAALMGLGAAIGPQVALVAAIAAVAGGLYMAKRASDDLNRRFTSAADAADQLAAASGRARRELRQFSDDESEVLSDDDFRKSIEGIIATLGRLEGADQQEYLMEIGLQMVLTGADPAEALGEVQRIAETAGVSIPVDLSVENIGDFQHQIDAAIASATRAQEIIGSLKGSDVSMPGDTQRELTAAAESAALLFQNDAPDQWARVMGEVVGVLGDGTEATNYFVDELLRLTDVGGLSTATSKDLASALDEMTGDASTASAPVKDLLTEIRAAAEAMDGGLTPANFAAAAALASTGDSAADIGAKLNEARGEAGGLSDELSEGTTSAEAFAAAVEKAGNRTALASLDFDASAAAADAFSDALDRSTQIDDRLGAGLKAGQALKDLREGLTGEKEIAELLSDTADGGDNAATAVDRLSAAARRAGGRMSGLELRLGTLSAAADAFSKSIAESTNVDDQISSVLSLGDAYRTFERTYRRLPHELDMAAVATGKLRPRTAEAVQNTLALGKAATDYLATLIEMGSTNVEVQGEAARMRGEYEKMFGQLGMNETQVRKWIEAMGLTPEQVTTAIELSGLEAARFQLTTYLDLLEGRIPASIATEVIASLEVGDVEGAAARLADFARQNPALLEVGVDGKSVDDTKSKIQDVRDGLMDLPGEFDPLKAALGEYSDAQSAALDAVMQFGDGVQDYLARVAHDGNSEEIRDQAYQIRDAFLEQLAQFGVTGEAAQEYLDLVGLSDWQIDSAINLSGDAEAMFRVQAYSDLLAGEIPPEVATEVLAAIDEGNLQGAADRLTQWRIEQQAAASANPVTLQVRTEWWQEHGFGAQARTAARGPGPWRPGFSTGGLVHGPGGPTTDDIAARLSAGEFVVTAKGVKAAGQSALEAINAGDPTALARSDLARQRSIGAPPAAAGRTPSVQVAVQAAAADGTLRGGTQTLDDSRLLRQLERVEAALAGTGAQVNFNGGIKVEAPSPERAARRVVQEVGAGLFMANRNGH